LYKRWNYELSRIIPGETALVWREIEFIEMQVAVESEEELMPKPILKSTQQTNSDSVLSLTPNQSAKQALSQESKMKIDRLLHKPRSKRYMETLCHLDAGGHTHNQQQTAAIIEALRQEFPEVELGGILLGIVSKCYLGKPYEVHTLDFTGGIIEHYQQGHAMPGRLEQARSIAIRGGYEFIEVYVDCCRAVSANGSVSVIS